MNIGFCIKKIIWKLIFVISRKDISTPINVDIWDKSIIYIEFRDIKHMNGWFCNEYASVEKRFYTRKTIAAFNCEIQQISFLKRGPFHATLLINPFLNYRISANHDKVEGFKPMVKYL